MAGGLRELWVGVYSGSPAWWPVSSAACSPRTSQGCRLWCPPAPHLGFLPACRCQAAARLGAHTDCKTATEFPGACHACREPRAAPLSWRGAPPCMPSIPHGERSLFQGVLGNNKLSRFGLECGATVRAINSTSWAPTFQKGPWDLMSC